MPLIYEKDGFKYNYYNAETPHDIFSTKLRT